MSRRPRVVLIVDHPLRDIGGLSLVAGELARQGVQVMLTPMAFQAEDCFTFAPDLVAVNYIRNNNAPFIRRLLDARIKVSLLDTEGGFYGDLSKYTKVLCRDQDIWDRLESVLVWGEKMYEYFQREIGLPQNLVKLTGVARFDLYHPRHKMVSSDLSRKSILANLNSESENVFLFNTKVALANPQFQTLEKEKALYLKLGFSSAEIEDLYKKGIEFIQNFSDLAAATAKLNLERVVLRPHPHERIETYKEKLQGTENLLVSRSGDFLGWLKNSKVIVHRHCTTAIEAALVGVPAISPQWIPTFSNLPDGESVSYRPTQRAEFLELIRAASKGELGLPGGAQEVLTRTTRDWLYRFDGLSYQRIASTFLHSVSGASVVDVKRCQKFLLQQFDEKAGVLGLALKSSVRVAPARKLLRKARVQRWRSQAKSFSREDVIPFVGSGVRVMSQENGSVVIEGEK